MGDAATYTDSDGVLRYKFTDTIVDDKTYLAENVVGAKPKSWETQGSIFDTKDRVFNADARLQSNFALTERQKAGGRSTAALQAARDRGGGDRGTSASLKFRVDGQLRENAINFSRSQAPSSVRGALSADQILQLYNNQDPSTYTAPDARLQLLQEQADSDSAASQPMELLTIYTRLVDDLSNIRAVDGWDYVRQMFDVLRADNRPLFFGIILVVFGLVGMALAPLAAPGEADVAEVRASPSDSPSDDLTQRQILKQSSRQILGQSIPQYTNEYGPPI